MTQKLTFEVRTSLAVKTTLDLMAGGYIVTDGYHPDVNAGGERDTDTFDVLIISTTESDLLEKIRAVEMALEFARQNPSGSTGVWMLYSPNSATAAYQSRITNGAVLHNSRMVGRFKEFKATLNVVVERMPYWESEDPVTLNINSMATASYGATASVSNCQDLYLGNYVFIQDTQDLGSLPTPAIIEIKPSVNDAEMLDHLYVGHFATPSTDFPPMGNASGITLEAMGTEDATCSNGEYSALTWTGTAEALLKTWTTFLSYGMALGRGHHFKLIARFRDQFVYTDLYLKAKILLGTDVIGETRWTLMEASRSMQMIGTLKVPPFRNMDYVAVEDLSLALYCKRSGGDGTINLDYIMLMAQDGWRQYKAIGAGLAYNKTLVDDPYEETLLATGDVSGYSKMTHLVESGNPILLQPDTHQALYFLHDLVDTSAPIDRTLTVSVKCRLRRRSI